MHTTVWPDSRIYSYASFDRARAYGLEAKADLRSSGAPGTAGYLNYALGRVYFFNPVTGGFVTEAAHLIATSRFLAPMDQTHTLTAGMTYRHAPSRVWLAGTIEYGSGTPMGHGGGHSHAAGAPHADAVAASGTPRADPDISRRWIDRTESAGQSDPRRADAPADVEKHREQHLRHRAGG